MNFETPRELEIRAKLLLALQEHFTEEGKRFFVAGDDDCRDSYYKIWFKEEKHHNIKEGNVPLRMSFEKFCHYVKPYSELQDDELRLDILKKQIENKNSLNSLEDSTGIIGKLLEDLTTNLYNRHGELKIDVKDLIVSDPVKAIGLISNLKKVGTESAIKEMEARTKYQPLKVITNININIVRGKDRVIVDGEVKELDEITMDKNYLYKDIEQRELAGVNELNLIKGQNETI